MHADQAPRRPRRPHRPRRPRRPRRGQTRTRRPRRPPRQRLPDRIERAYARVLVKIARRGQQLVEETVIPRLPELERLALPDITVTLDDHGDILLRGRVDALPWIGILAGLFETLRARMARLIRPEFLERLAGAAAGEVSEHNKQEMTRQMRSAIGVDIFLTDPTLAETTAGFVAANVDLIKSIPEQLFEKVEKTIREGFRRGRRAEQLAPEIARQFGVSDRRARFIARDQIAKLNGQLTQERQTELGIGEYIWRTSLDERVRPSHARLEGTVQSWDDPPETDGGRQVHPGEDYNCRCTAEPKIPGIEAIKTSPEDVPRDPALVAQARARARRRRRRQSQ